MTVATLKFDKKNGKQPKYKLFRHNCQE